MKQKYSKQLIEIMMDNNEGMTEEQAIEILDKQRSEIAWQLKCDVSRVSIGIDNNIKKQIKIKVDL